MSECNSVTCYSVEQTYYQRNRDVILNRAKDYHKNDKERLRDNARDKYKIYLREKELKREKMEEEANKKLWFLVKHYINFYEFNSAWFSHVILNP